MHTSRIDCIKINLFLNPEPTAAYQKLKSSKIVIRKGEKSLRQWETLVICHSSYLNLIQQDQFEASTEFISAGRQIIHHCLTAQQHYLLLLVTSWSILCLESTLWLMKITNNLASHVPCNGFFMVQNAIRSCNNNITPLTCWKHFQSILLNISSLDILPVSESFAIFYSALQFNSYLPHSVGIMNLETLHISWGNKTKRENIYIPTSPSQKCHNIKVFSIDLTQTDIHN